MCNYALIDEKDGGVYFFFFLQIMFELAAVFLIKKVLWRYW